MSERLYFINGLPALYEKLKEIGKENEAKEIIKKFLNQSFNMDLDEKVERFRRIPTGIFPADMEYFRIFWELNQIYISGLYYSTVVTAGVLCERMCHDILEKNSIKAKKKACLGDLIRLLSANHLVKTETLAEMKEIRKKRNSYVHPSKKKSDSKKEEDALKMIERISKILNNEFRV